MIRGRSLRTLFVLAAGVTILCAVSPAAINPSQVLVLYNSDSPDGLQIAEYYAQAHPGVHLLGLTGVTTNETINAQDYLNVIRPQVMAFLAGTPDIECFVTTKGLPVRIHNTSSSAGYFMWKPFSSLESELTRIDTIDTLAEMGDQAYILPTGHQSVNPYYQASAGFDRGSYGGIRLASRLDGYTADDVIASIDRAQHAVFNPAGQDAVVVIDDDPNAVATLSDRMGYLTSTLSVLGKPYVFDNTDTAIVSAVDPVIGYVSHGVNDGAGGLASGYIDNQLNFNLADGAVFQTYESFNAYSFVEGGNCAGQELLAEWLAAGGTAGVGHVEEPSTGGQNIANEDIFWQMLLGGYTWAEAAWSSIYQLSYVNTVVGDPLMTFRLFVPGDMNGDGLVDGVDIDLLFANLTGSGTPAANPVYDLDGDGDADVNDVAFLIETILGTKPGDFNLDRVVNSADLTRLATNFGGPGSWQCGDANGDKRIDLTDMVILATNYGFVNRGTTPEPATMALLGLAGLAITIRRRLR